MSRRLILAIAAAFVVAACAEDREQSPTAPGSAVTPEYLVGATCNYTDLKKYARNLFGSTGLGTKLAGEMSKFAKDSPNATTIGFNIFAEVARKRDEGPWTAQNVEDAANLTVQVINCSNVHLTAGTVGLLANLKLALAKPSGAYAVRGGGDVEDPVLTSDKQSGVSPKTGTWGNWLTTRTLVYGYPTSLFSGGEQTANIVGTGAYDWSLVRRLPLQPPLTDPTKYNGLGKVTVCLTVLAETDTEASKYRLQKPASILEVDTDVAGIDCVLQSVALTLPERLIDYATRMVLPSELHAAALVATTKSTSPSSNAGSFSPFQGGNPGATVMSWDNPPADGTIASVKGTDGTEIRVLVQGSLGTPWTGVWLHIYGIDNNGAKTEFTSSCAITGDDGKARFTGLGAPKTGGFSMFVETQSSVCTTDTSVEGYDPATLAAPNRIIVRP